MKKYRFVFFKLTMPRKTVCSVHFLYLAVVITLFFSSHHLFASKSSSNFTKWYSLSNKFSCVLSASVKQTDITPITKQQHKPLTKYIYSPILTPPLTLSLSLQYTGRKTILVKWDKMFSRMLWEQDFVLITTQNKISLSSKEAFLTSNIGRYPASEEITLAPHATLKSILKLRGYIGAGLRQGKATFQLYVANNRNGLIPICNPVNVMIN